MSGRTNTVWQRWARAPHVAPHVHAGLCALLLSLCATGCSGKKFASYVVKTPNYGRPAHALTGRGGPEMGGTTIDYELLIPVGPPTALMSVWIIDPSNEVIVDEDDETPVFGIPGGGERKLRPPHSTVVLVHGFHGYKGQYHMLVWARALAIRGYRAVLVDLRGHGRSTGDWATYGPQEARDISQVIDALQGGGLLVGGLGYVGFSYGGTVGLHLAAIDDRVDAVVGVAPFSNMRTVVPEFARGWVGWVVELFPDAVIHGTVDAAGDLAGFDPDAADARPLIAGDDTPVLLLHGEDDRLVQPKHSLELAKASGGNATVLILGGFRHATLGIRKSRPVRDAVYHWLDMHLDARAAATPEPDTDVGQGDNPE